MPPLNPLERPAALVSRRGLRPGKSPQRTSRPREGCKGAARKTSKVIGRYFRLTFTLLTSARILRPPGMGLPSHAIARGPLHSACLERRVVVIPTADQRRRTRLCC